MRNLLYAAGAAAFVLVSSDAVRPALAAAASALFEATPFLVAGVLLSTAIGRCGTLAEYFGCGCGRGASARSIPAAVAAWLLFGPAVAIARYLAACAVTFALHRSGREPSAHRESSPLLGELAALLPSAAIAGVAIQLGSLFEVQRLSPTASALLGAALGFTAAPCGLGAIAVGAALRVRAPVAAAAFLCIAGIFDVRALKRRPPATNRDDALAYLLLAAALAIVAVRRGDALVHPAFTAALACSAAIALVMAIVVRRCRCAGSRAAPLVMLIGAFIAAPPPRYEATETTLTDLYAGERLNFTGALAQDGRTAAVVRYAITCCRADAAPVALRLDRVPRFAAGTWLRVDGRVDSSRSGFVLVARSIERVAAPADPFIYR